MRGQSHDVALDAHQNRLGQSVQTATGPVDGPR